MTSEIAGQSKSQNVASWHREVLCLRRSALTGSRQLMCGIFKNSFFALQGLGARFSSEPGKVKAVRKQNDTLAQLLRCRNELPLDQLLPARPMAMDMTFASPCLIDMESTDKLRAVCEVCSLRAFLLSRAFKFTSYRGLRSALLPKQMNNKRWITKNRINK